MRLSIAKNDTKELELFVDGESKIVTVASFVSPEARKAAAQYPEDDDFHNVLAALVIDWDLEDDLASIIKEYDALANMIHGTAMQITNEIKESKKL